MKKGILVLIDLEENLEGLLDYTFEIAKFLKLDINLLHCYPKANYNQKFDFKKVSYAEGIKGMLKESVTSYLDSESNKSTKVKYLAAAGSAVNFVSSHSKEFELILMRTQIFSNSINKFLNSNIPYLTDASKCPIIIVPPSASFDGLDNCWILERKDTDIEVINGSSKMLKLNPASIKVKRFDQNKYSSNLWKLLNSKLDFKSYQTRNTIAKEIENEQVDLILLASYSQEGFKAFMNVNLARIIFQLGIPIMISHKN